MRVKNRDVGRDGVETSMVYKYKCQSIRRRNVALNTNKDVSDCNGPQEEKGRTSDSKRRHMGVPNPGHTKEEMERATEPMSQ